MSSPPSETPETTSTSATPTPSPTPSPVPPPLPLETHPNRAAFKPANRPSTEPSLLTPGDAYKSAAPPRLRPLTEINGSAAASAAAAALRPAVAALRAPPAIPPVAARLAEGKRRNASRRRRLPHVWKKLLWIKQHGYPDNYTDTETFLDHLQRNPRLSPYDFWTLVADSTVIVQHVCSVALFVCAYAGIYQDRLSPVTVVLCGAATTLVGWILWDRWVEEEEVARASHGYGPKRTSVEVDDGSSTSSGSSSLPLRANGHMKESNKPGAMGLSLSMTNLAAQNDHVKKPNGHSQSHSRSSYQSISPIDTLNEPFPPLERTKSAPVHSPTYPRSPTSLSNSISPRNQARLKTFKSALLIYFALLGLSPILKSLTKSTSSDSIWALATWLLIINIFFFDYGSHTPSRPQPRPRAVSNVPLAHPDGTALLARSPPFPSSLSTNAALMASTVLASRLTTTTAVFSLTLFSIQVFGLFPVFRRHLRAVSLPLHVLLTIALIVTATSGLGLILSQSYTHTYGDCNYCLSWIWHIILRGLIGIIVFGGSTVLVMLACAWWLMNLQKFKNTIKGPWDVARPRLAGGDYGRRGTVD